jgi:hypothetical protein
VIAQEAANAASQEMENQKVQKKEDDKSVWKGISREPIVDESPDEISSEREIGSSSRKHKTEAGIVERIVGGGAPQGEEGAPLVNGGSELAEGQKTGAKPSLVSKWFGKGNATSKSEEAPSAAAQSGLIVSSSSDKTERANGESGKSDGEQSGFWNKAKGFIKKKIGKRGEGDSDDDEEERRVRRQPIDDSGWGSDEDDVSNEPGGFHTRLWRAGSRRSSRKSVGSRRASRRSSAGSQGEMTSSQPAAARRSSAAGRRKMSAKEGVRNSIAEGEAVRENGSNGGKGAMQKEQIEGQVTVAGDGSGTLGSPSQATRVDTWRPEEDPVLKSIRAQVGFGLGLLQLLVSLIPTTVSILSEGRSFHLVTLLGFLANL